MRGYKDFHLRLVRAGGVDDHVTVLESPAGSGSSATRLLNDRDRIKQLWLHIGAALRRPMSPLYEEVAAQLAAFGGDLFTSAFPERVRTLLDRSWGSVLASPKREDGLRIKLRFDPTDRSLAWLADLPWEALRVPGASADPLSPLDRRLSIVRYVEVAQPPDPVELEPPLRVLGLAAQPLGVAPLGIDAERAAIGVALGQIPNVKIETVKPATRQGLRRMLRTFKPHVLHFTGHGLIDEARGVGQIVLEDQLGRPDPVDAHSLAEILLGEPSVRLVLLNACLTASGGGTNQLASVAGALVGSGVPAVVGMQFEISDGAARVFAEEVYARMAEGGILDDAVAEGRQAIRTASPRSFEWCTPVLFMRSADGVLLTATPKTAADRSAMPGPTAGPRAPSANVSQVGGNNTANNVGDVKGSTMTITVTQTISEGDGRGRGS